MRHKDSDKDGGIMVKVEFLGPIKREGLSIEAKSLSEVANI
mgnify:CR=1 FL=1